MSSKRSSQTLWFVAPSQRKRVRQMTAIRLLIRFAAFSVRRNPSLINGLPLRSFLHARGQKTECICHRPCRFRPNQLMEFFSTDLSVLFHETLSTSFSLAAQHHPPPPLTRLSQVNTRNDVLIATGVRSQNHSDAPRRLWRSFTRRHSANSLL